jgi:DNA-directed RNA polymerase beta subunit
LLYKTSKLISIKKFKNENILTCSTNLQTIMTAIPLPVDQIRNVLHKSLAGLTSELSLGPEGRLLRHVVTKDGFSENVKAIYNNWVTVVLPQQFAAQQLKSSDGIITFAPKIRFDSDGTRSGPMRTIGQKSVRLTPRMCREHNLNYVVGCWVKAIYTPQERTTPLMTFNRQVRQSVVQQEEIYIGDIPVMLGSILCWLYRCSDVEYLEMGECPNDPLGYFIIKGSEKVIIIQEKLRASLPNTFIADSKGKVQTRTTCVTPTGTKIVTIQVGKTWQTLKVGLSFLQKEHHLPLFVVFRMLGVDIPQAMDIIYKYIPEEEHEKCKYALQASIAKADSQRHDMTGYISNKLKMGAVTPDNYAKREQDIQLKIIDDLFPNLEQTNIALKLEHLAFMASRTLRYLIGTRQLDNRDSWAIKRLETAGRALQQLMDILLKEMFKKAQESIGEGKTFSFQLMLQKINRSFITEGISKSFGSNSWGGIGSYRKENIVDTLKRETPTSVYSQIGRVNTPANRQAAKESLRRLQPSQLGYVCISGDSLVLSNDKTNVTRIDTMKNGDRVMTANIKTLEEEPSAIGRWFEKIPDKVLQITTISGRSIKCDPQHPLLVVTDDNQHVWVKAGDLKSEQKLVIKHFNIPLSSEGDNLVISSKDISFNYIEPLQKMGLVDVSIPSEKIAILARLLGIICRMNIEKKDSSDEWNVRISLENKEDIDDMKADISSLGFDVNVFTVFKNGSHWTFEPGCMFTALIMTAGEMESDQESTIPSWIMKGSMNTKRQFLSFFTNYVNDIPIIDWTLPLDKQIIIYEHPNNNLTFCKEIQELFKDLDINIHIIPTINYFNRKSVTLYLEGSYVNVSKYFDVVSYRYSQRWRQNNAVSIEYLKYRLQLQKSKYEELSNIINPMTYDQFEKLYTTGTDRVLCPISEIKQIDIEKVYDFTTISNNHSFYANGFLVSNCPAETPEGDACGLVKNLAMTCYISRDHLEQDIDLILEEEGIFDMLSDDKDDDHPHPFLKNGNLHKWCHAPSMTEALRGLILTGRLPKDVMVFNNEYDHVMEFFYDGARATRPLLVVDADGQLVIDKLNMWDEDIDTLVQNGALEYVDARCQEYIMLATDTEQVRSRAATIQRLQTTLNDPQSSDKERETAEEALVQLKLRIPFTHCEIDPIAPYGFAVGIMPQPNRGQGPRVTYQASMCKQALNQYHLNHHLRFDTSFKVFQAPSRPFFETELAYPGGLNFMPAGDNIIVAFMALEDNQEDGIVANAELLKRKFKMVKYTTHRCIAKNVRDIKERFIRPIIKRGEPAGRYDAIEPNGLPRLDAYIRQGDCIIGKMRDNLETGRTESACMYAGVGEEGYIDRVLVTWNAEDHIVVKVKIRQTRQQQEGDKFASRYSQKGTICAVVPANELPRIIGGPNDGVVPHFFINPLSIPSRMTVNKMAEMNGSKGSAYNNTRLNATGFRSFTLQPSKDTLNEYGLEENGLEYMLRPDGKMYNNQINVAVCCYQMLRHHVLDKIQMRAEGAIRPVSHQPVGGRAYEGGLKIGEMERDAIISHEAIENLWERLCGVSDKYTTVACQECGRIAISNSNTRVSICMQCGDKARFGVITIPYAIKLLNSLLSACNFDPTFDLQVLKTETDRPEELFLTN